MWRGEVLSTCPQRAGALGGRLLDDRGSRSAQIGVCKVVVKSEKMVGGREGRAVGKRSPAEKREEKGEGGRWLADGGLTPRKFD